MYDINEHRYRFSLWASARASQRAFTDTKTIICAIKKSELRGKTCNNKEWSESPMKFDEFHRKICNDLIENLNHEKATYGRVAKILAIYLKINFILSEDKMIKSVKFIHPPIDRILLAQLAKEFEKKDKNFSNYCKKIKWTKLNEDEYFELINKLRENSLDQDSFWCIEKYWNP